MKPYYATPGDGIFHFYFPGAGTGAAGAVHPGRRLAQPRLRRVRRGRHGRRFDDARLRLVHRLHLFHAGEGAPRRVHRRAAALGRGQGHRPRAAAALGRAAVAGHVGRVRRSRAPAADRVSQHDREHDGGGGGAQRHLRGRRHHVCVVRAEGDHRDAVPAHRARRDGALRDRRGAVAAGRGADDREAVQPGQRVPGGGGRARADPVRQGADRIVHQRQLRRPAAGGARHLPRAQGRPHQGDARVRRLSRVGRRRQADRASRPAARRRIDRRACSDRSAGRFASRGAAPASARVPTR